MNFKTLKEKGEYYRSLTDYRLLPNSYAVIMLDGRSFSHKVKNKFKKPFDDDFVRMMNETTKYLCENIQGALCGYCQSDEIHIVISDFVKSYKLHEDWSVAPTDKEGISSAFFQYRISKILSIVASMASSIAKFGICLTPMMSTLGFFTDKLAVLEILSSNLLKHIFLIRSCLNFTLTSRLNF